MKKIGILAIVLIFALGSLGVGYAMWSDTLTITGDVNTGSVQVAFTSQYDNDINDDDPMEEGIWTVPGYPTVPTWDGDRYGKDVASTTSTFVQGGEGHTARIIITNGYPSYWGSTIWDISNIGSVPVKLWSVTLVGLSKDGSPTWTGSTPLDIGTQYFVNIETDNVDETLDPNDDFSFILSAHLTDQIDPDNWDEELWNLRGYLDVTVHVEQDATQKTDFDFVIDYVFANWNEPELT